MALSGETKFIEGGLHTDERGNIRFVNDFQWTATHKIKKNDLKNDGYNLSAIKDGLYVLLPGTETYVPLNDAIYQDIMAGKYKF